MTKCCVTSFKACRNPASTLLMATSMSQLTTLSVSVGGGVREAESPATARFGDFSLAKKLCQRFGAQCSNHFWDIDNFAQQAAEATHIIPSAEVSLGDSGAEQVIESPTPIGLPPSLAGVFNKFQDYFEVGVEHIKELKEQSEKVVREGSSVEDRDNFKSKYAGLAVTLPNGAERSCDIETKAFADKNSAYCSWYAMETYNQPE